MLSFEVTLQFWSPVGNKKSSRAPFPFSIRTPHQSSVWGTRIAISAAAAHALLSAHQLFADQQFQRFVLRRSTIDARCHESQREANQKVAGHSVDFWFRRGFRLSDAQA